MVGTPPFDPVYQDERLSSRVHRVTNEGIQIALTRDDFKAIGPEGCEGCPLDLPP